MKPTYTVPSLPAELPYPDTDYWRQLNMEHLSGEMFYAASRLLEVTDDPDAQLLFQLSWLMFEQVDAQTPRRCWDVERVQRSLAMPGERRRW